ncbi:uridine kinase [Megavirus baoshan]|uniref:Uridine kinase n=1 Tax=Megavirus baoshan TaxID=2496520 RepID=A0A3S8UX81_9VIRU|nr:uridine kinase [Megavirus baoshan]AZL89435.1 uridine kinase [Megavirus baoshan]
MEILIAVIISFMVYFIAKELIEHASNLKKMKKIYMKEKKITGNLVNTKNTKEYAVIDSMINKFTDTHNKTLKTPYIIGICGGSGSGKTFVTSLITETIAKMFPNDEKVLIISQDSYYKGGNSETNYDIPDSIDFDLLEEHLEMLSLNKSIESPIYDFVTHSRKSETMTLHPAKIIIVEGILIFTQERLRNLLNMKIFINADEPTQIFRRTIRDVAERGRDIEEVQLRVTRDVWPSYKTHVLPSSIYADMSINNFNNCYVGPQIMLNHIITVFKSLN